MQPSQFKKLQFAPVRRFSSTMTITPPTPKEITDWLEKSDQSRADLAKALNVSADTVKGWLSANRPITGAALQLLVLLMKPKPVVNPEFTLDEWDQIEALARAEGITAREWITRVLKRELGNAPAPKTLAHTVNAGQTTPLVQAATSFGHITPESGKKVSAEKGTGTHGAKPRTPINLRSGGRAKRT